MSEAYVSAENLWGNFQNCGLSPQVNQEKGAGCVLF
jgi:hypothetical protein